LYLKWDARRGLEERERDEDEMMIIMEGHGYEIADGVVPELRNGVSRNTISVETCLDERWRPRSV
jgi:hypothetical protein